MLPDVLDPLVPSADSSPIVIQVDDREPEAKVLDALRRWPGLEIRVERLRVGDYLVAGRCVFERKSLTDFARSVADGRLFSQARRLAGQALPAALVLEGRSADLASTGFRREALLGALVSVTVVFGVPVLRALDAGDTARLLVYAGQQMHRLGRGLTPRHDWRPRSKRRLQLHILQGLPGIGPRRARQLLETFGTVAAVINTPADQLEAVSGIGPKTAQAIQWALH